MGWKPSPDVAEARDVARKFHARRVIIILTDEEHVKVISYGETKPECDKAKRQAELAFEAVYGDEVGK
jgi:hypothetical protein